MTLPKTAEAIIIGGGINGASIAYHLANLGMNGIVVLERARVGHGASGRGAGIVRTYYNNEAEARLAVASLATFRNWRDEIGGTAGFTPTGFLWMAGPEATADLRSIVARQRALGARSQVLTPREIVALHPRISAAGLGAAAYEPDGGYGNPAAATASLIAAAKRLSVSVYQDVAVTAIITRGPRVAGVSTGAADMSSPLVILAAGAWSVPLASSAGVMLPLTPVRMTTGVIRRAPLAGAPITFIDTVTDTFFRPDDEPGIAHISIRDARHDTLLGSGDGWLREPVDRAASLHGIARLKIRIPSLDAQPFRAWVGPDGVTSDRRAIYGKVKSLDGLVLCVGGNYKGFKVAPAVGRSLAELIVNGTSAIDLAPFALERFGSFAHPYRAGGYDLSHVA